MGSNSFGTIFRITTWGESHGKGIGVVIDGCPAGIPLSEDDINQELFKRQGGKTPYTTPRLEKDHAEIFSGVFEGKTTGAPISIIIFNHNVDSSAYEPIKDLLRPGHSNYPYLKKYGIFDYRGGGRSSGRETACRVAAGAVAKKILTHFGISSLAYIKEIGGIQIEAMDPVEIGEIRKKTEASPIFCPDALGEKKIIQAILQIKEEKDSLGGIVECITTPLPIGLGDPIYEKLEANLAKAILSIPATKGFEIGSGFEAAKLKGSTHNDLFIADDQGQISTKTNYAGGTLGGITIGMPLIFRVAFKPTSSIEQKQETVDLTGNSQTIELSNNSRHDPCIAIRAVPVVEAMANLVLVDCILRNRLSKI